MFAVIITVLFTAMIVFIDKTATFLHHSRADVLTWHAINS